MAAAGQGGELEPSVNSAAFAASHEEKKRQEAAFAARNLKQLYDDLIAGRPPSNESLTSAISRFQSLLQDESTKNQRLNDRGRVFTQDMRNLLESSKRILVEKNPDDKIQSFLLHSAIAARELSQQVGAPTDLEATSAESIQQAREDLKKTLFHGRKVVTLLASSPEFRNSMSTLLDISKALLASPESRQSLMQAIKSAPSAVTSQLQAAVGPRVSEEEEEEEYEEYEEYESEELSEEPEEVVREMQQAYSVYPEGIVSRPVESKIEQISGSKYSRKSETTALASQARSASQAPQSSGSDLSRKLSSTIDDDTRKRLQADVFRVLDTLSSNEDFRNGVESLFRLMSLVGASVWQIGSSRYDSVSNTPNLQQAIQDGKDVVEHFIGAGRLEPLFNHSRNFALIVKDDPEISTLLQKIQNYFYTAFREPGILKEARFVQKGRKYFDHMSNVAYRYRNQPDVVFVVNESRSILETIRTDDTLVGFTTALDQLTSDITFVDTAGKRRFQPEMLEQIKSIVVPLMVEQLHYVPIPPMSATGPIYDWSVENIVFSGYDIVPEHIFIDTLSHTDLKPLSDSQHDYVEETIDQGRNVDTHGRTAYKHHKYGFFGRKYRAHWPPREAVAPSATSMRDSNTAGSGPVLGPESHMRTTGQIVIRAYSINFNLKGIKFSFSRKTFPRIQDSGLADVATKGSSGCKVIIRLDMASDDTSGNLVTGGALSVNIAPLAIKFHNNKHTVILPTLGKVFSRTIRKKAEAAIADRLGGIMKNLVNGINESARRTPGAASKLRDAVRGGMFNFKGTVMSAASKMMEATKGNVGVQSAQ
jgi:hypothetical protein